jgi:CRISPR/Cas system-associated protein Cas10 (large subunit of type III CRISPR-Cas system)
MTLSAGVELFKPATPVSHAVENAEELLELSKDPSKGKNKITLFRETMSWDEELPAQIRFAEDWEKFINETSDDKSINRNAMLYRFLRYHDEYRQAPENSMEKMKHRFRFVYDISRNLAPKNGEKDWRNEKPFTDLLITKTPNMEESLLFKYLPVGIAISAYKTRSKKETTGRNK